MWIAFQFNIGYNLFEINLLIGSDRAKEYFISETEYLSFSYGTYPDSLISPSHCCLKTSWWCIIRLDSLYICQIIPRHVLWELSAYSVLLEPQISLSLKIPICVVFWSSSWTLPAKVTSTPKTALVFGTQSFGTVMTLSCWSYA
jgi:hypothetical protein